VYVPLFLQHWLLCCSMRKVGRQRPLCVQHRLLCWSPHIVGSSMLACAVDVRVHSVAHICGQPPTHYMRHSPRKDLRGPSSSWGKGSAELPRASAHSACAGTRPCGRACAPRNAWGCCWCWYCSCCWEAGGALVGVQGCCSSGGAGGASVGLQGCCSSGGAGGALVGVQGCCSIGGAGGA